VNEPPQAQPRADAPPPEAPLAEAPLPEAGVAEAPVVEAVAVETAPEPQPQRSWPAAAAPEAHADQRVGQLQSRPLAEDDSAVRFAWIASLALLVALVLAAWQYREDVMRFWPASKAVYQVLGLTGS
jgi:hypothetical protein